MNQQNKNIIPPVEGDSPWDLLGGRTEQHVMQKVCVHMCEHVRTRMLHCIQLFVTPWTIYTPSFSVHGVFQARVLEK